MAVFAHHHIDTVFVLSSREVPVTLEDQHDQNLNLEQEAAALFELRSQTEQTEDSRKDGLVSGVHTDPFEFG